MLRRRVSGPLSPRRQSTGGVMDVSRPSVRFQRRRAVSGYCFRSVDSLKRFKRASSCVHAVVRAGSGCTWSSNGTILGNDDDAQPQIRFGRTSCSRVGCGRCAFIPRMNRLSFGLHFCSLSKVIIQRFLVIVVVLLRYCFMLKREPGVGRYYS